MEVTKFSDKRKTAKGEERGFVDYTGYKNLWFNTGTLCNLSCENCYIESSPKNDRLQYLMTDDVGPYLEEIHEQKYEINTIAFTGGEPFLNPSIIEIISLCQESGFNVLILTNAYRVLKKHQQKLLELDKDKLQLRVSLDHYTKEIHERERGKNTFDLTLLSAKWIEENGFQLSIAGRSLQNEDPQDVKNHYQKLLNSKGINLELSDDNLVIFPEMGVKDDVPEITTACWDILGITPESIMCASERMIVRKKGSDRPQVQACTLLAYNEEFNLGSTLSEAKKRVYLNHRSCAEFCVLGGASCSSTV